MQAGERFAGNDLGAAMLATSRPVAFLAKKGKHRMFTSAQASKQPSPTDPLSVWNQSQRVLFAVAHQVRRAIRLKLDGHGRTEAEPEGQQNPAPECEGRTKPERNFQYETPRQ